MSEVILKVPDISCEHCERTILETLQGQSGIKSVRVSIPDKTVRRDYDEKALNLQEIGALLAEEGYPVAGNRLA
ncbi:MAG: heavy-metal-associated domain-containing protein [Chloroflexia bacterium]